MNYFKNCETLQEVKQLYRELCKVHHPDKGGELETMQHINSEYSKAINIIAKGGSLTIEEQEAEILNAEAYKDAINAIINLPDIEIEICGGWIWVSGDTYTHRAIFKSNGFFYASKKVKWYFRSAEYKTKNTTTMSMEDIRGKYGSLAINAGNFRKQLA